MQTYALGFLFDPYGEKVVLIRKRVPAWQRNRYNGVGGKCNENEPPDHAMQREFEEETGLCIEDWQPVCELSGDGFAVYVYAAYSENLHEVETQYEPPGAGEAVGIFPVNELPPAALPNVRWLIPMALSLSRGETARSFIVNEMK